MLIIFGDKVSETRGNTCGLLIKDGQRVDSDPISFRLSQRLLYRVLS